MKTAADLDIKWKWRDSPPTSLPGFKGALVRAWFEKFGRDCLECGRLMQHGKGWRGHNVYATIDHILARSLGGTEDLQNLRVICYRCNHMKSRDENQLLPSRQGRMPKKLRAATGENAQSGHLCAD